jgi:hypothetical protein
MRRLLRVKSMFVADQHFGVTKSERRPAISAIEAFSAKSN